jgi:integrase/recombinase XerC
MIGQRPARVLAQADVRLVLGHVEGGGGCSRNKAMVMLSVYAGLRACEVSGLTWPMALQPDGEIDCQLRIADRIAKNGGGRRIPMHPKLARVLMRLHRQSGQPREGPIIVSARGGAMTAKAIVNVGLDGCSSHSGRRTFITRSARMLAQVGGSLRDVQELAGHRALTTTERYIEGDRDAQRRLIALL